MALKNTTDPIAAARALESWLATKLPDASDIAVTDVTTPEAAGMSAETLLFDAAWTTGGDRFTHNFVARVAPSTPGIFPSYQLEKEFAVIDALFRRTAVPMPQAWWSESDTSIFGGPFLVLSRVDGRIAADDPPFTAAGWVADLSAADRRRLIENSLTGMAAIHAADWRTIGLEFLEPDAATSRIDQQIHTWRAYFDWARAGEANPTIEAGFRWLEANRPKTEGPTVLNWGDARLGNQIIADDLTVAATLDWEMVDLGTREMDLAWWIFILRHHTEGIGVPVPEGIPSRAEIVASYERVSGHVVVDLDYYEVFAAVRLAAIMHRAGNLMIELGFLPPDAPMRLNNPASQLLAKLIGQDAPSGDAQTFIGNRS
ncbi:phosphotransferase family protein [Antrihabitans sp. YC2-6]|uniref:phosphotransferase family protein n=1 Tax=Antrihabitans sp. YC2-6 TaxID=2799498 RepID=UPI0018F44CAB|nr:phosphotransferase family protein [Antrihabitans sp. YC2-6]MBJ8345199.1 phosphotransferase family protein [Antrihabitans sp. YC2-6]